jgi:hypothetical protein
MTFAHISTHVIIFIVTSFSEQSCLLEQAY